MPFGIDDALIWAPLAGAVLGGLTNKKDPLKGAMVGGALGYGGAAMPGLLGATGAAPVAAEAAPVFDAVAGADGVAKLSQVAAQGQALPAAGLLGDVKNAASVVKPIGEAAASANAVNGLLTPRRQQIQAAQFVPSQGGAQSLAQLSNALQQNQLSEQQALAEQRARRMKLIGG